MPCDTRIDESELSRRRMQDALKRLDAALGAGTVSVVVGAQGGIAFKGWTEGREGWSDVCAYRRLASGNSPALRKALARAEALAGRKADPRAIGAGLHSHDGGQTWGTH